MKKKHSSTSNTLCLILRLREKKLNNISVQIELFSGFSLLFEQSLIGNNYILKLPNLTIHTYRAVG